MTELNDAARALLEDLDRLKPAYDHRPVKKRLLEVQRQVTDSRVAELRALVQDLSSALAYGVTSVNEGERPHWCRFPAPKHDSMCAAMLHLQEEARRVLKDTEQ